eukprot:8596153-Pyramimonas_sp.AAC.1
MNPVKTKPVRLAMRVAAHYYKQPSRAMVPIAIREWGRVCAVGFAGTRAGQHHCLSFVLCTFVPCGPVRLPGWLCGIVGGFEAEERFYTLW